MFDRLFHLRAAGAPCRKSQLDGGKPQVNGGKPQLDGGKPQLAGGKPQVDGGEGGQELKRCWVFSRPSAMRLSTASAAESTWKGSSLRSVVL